MKIWTNYSIHGKKESKHFWEIISCEFLNHIKTNICWFNVTYCKLRYEKKTKNSIFNFICDKHDRIKVVYTIIISEYRTKNKDPKTSWLKSLLNQWSMNCRIVNGYLYVMKIYFKLFTHTVWHENQNIYTYILTCILSTKKYFATLM